VVCFGRSAVAVAVAVGVGVLDSAPYP